MALFILIVAITLAIFGLTRSHSPPIKILAVVSLLALFIGILLPALGALRRTARGTQTSSQTRGIHQALIIQAQSNNNWYAGLDNAGNIIAPAIEARFQILLDNKHFNGQYAISPSETKTPWSAGPVTTDNYSYAMLQIPRAGARHNEWRTTNNKLAPILADRLIPHGTGFKSVHVNPKLPNATEWRGSVAWNDNHVSFEPDFILDTQYTTTPNPNDNLFHPTTRHDAWMIYTGNGEHEPSPPSAP